MSNSIPTLVGGLLGIFVILRADLRRRRLSLARVSGWSLLSALDVVCPAVILGTAAGIIPVATSHGTLVLYSPLTLTTPAGALVVAFVWGEGRRQIQFQRPRGIVFGESLILAGATLLIEMALFSRLRAKADSWMISSLAVAAILGGAIVIAAIVPAFVKKYEGHHILDRVAAQVEFVQAEYVPPTPECPHPELWQMVDSQTSELEVLDFLKSVVITVKPRLIVETGTFIGYSAVKMAEGLRANGFGKIVTIEFDPAIFAKAKERIDSSGLGEWIEYRNESSLETRIDGTIDFLFSDSHLTIREQEIRRFLPQIDPRGLILIHDASSHFHVVREAALRLEQEGLISVVLLPTPRGLVIAQKHGGRK
ncbi:MAG TPA: class I SAM-dependent methyltransferase [Candidatus Acidoferrales bacterium]|nr:class I SAM-dependent methyltransferase [Candidatus Acidoferrales bacterium]